VAAHAVFGLFLREFYVFQNVILEVEWRQRSGEGARAPRGGTARRAGLVLPGVPRADAACVAERILEALRRSEVETAQPLNAGWHLNMLPYALAEVIYTARFVPLFIRGLRTEG
jgi:hypothetical protein